MFWRASKTSTNYARSARNFCKSSMLCLCSGQLPTLTSLVWTPWICGQYSVRKARGRTRNLGTDWAVSLLYIRQFSLWVVHLIPACSQDWLAQQVERKQLDWFDANYSDRSNPPCFTWAFLWACCGPLEQWQITEENPRETKTVSTKRKRIKEDKGNREGRIQKGLVERRWSWGRRRI